MHLYERWEDKCIPIYTEHMLFFSSFEDIDGEIDDLIAYFEQELTLDSPFPEICSPELDMTQVHISG